MDGFELSGTGWYNLWEGGNHGILGPVGLELSGIGGSGDHGILGPPGLELSGIGGRRGIMGYCPECTRSHFRNLLASPN